MFAVAKNVPIDDATRETDLERYIADGRAVEGQNLEELYMSCTPMVVLESTSGWNVVAFRKNYYAISQAVGPVDLANASADWIRAHVGAGVLVVADTLDDARLLAAITVPPVAESPTPAPPRLLESLEGYNVVSYANQFFGVPQAMGPVDVDSPHISARPGVIIDLSLDGIRARIRKTGQSECST